MSELEEYKRRVIAFENAARKKGILLIEMSLGAIKITGCKRHGKYST